MSEQQTFRRACPTKWRKTADMKKLRHCHPMYRPNCRLRFQTMFNNAYVCDTWRQRAEKKSKRAYNCRNRSCETVEFSGKAVSFRQMIAKLIRSTTNSDASKCSRGFAKSTAWNAVSSKISTWGPGTPNSRINFYAGQFSHYRQHQSAKEFTICNINIITIHNINK